MKRVASKDRARFYAHRIDVIERQIMQHEMNARPQERKRSSEQGAFEEAREGMAALKEKSNALKAEWQKEKALIDEQWK